MKGLYAMGAAERIILFSSQEPFSGCWLWIHTMYTNGYGMLQFRGQLHLAHRLSYEAYVGPIPEGMDLDHLCRVRSCVNPMHLQPVSRSTNVLRGLVSTAHDWKPGLGITHCPQGHPYSPENTRLYKTHRTCRECHRLGSADYYRKNREAVLQKLRDKTKAKGCKA